MKKETALLIAIQSILPEIREYAQKVRDTDVWPCFIFRYTAYMESLYAKFAAKWKEKLGTIGITSNIVELPDDAIELQFIVAEPTKYVQFLEDLGTASIVVDETIQEIMASVARRIQSIRQNKYSDETELAYLLDIQPHLSTIQSLYVKLGLEGFFELNKGDATETYQPFTPSLL